MNKPQIKQEVGVSTAHKSVEIIYFHSTVDALDDIRAYGRVHPSTEGRYCLTVDARFDFDDVLEFLTNYGLSEEQIMEKNRETAALQPEEYMDNSKAISAPTSKANEVALTIRVLGIVAAITTVTFFGELWLLGMVALLVVGASHFVFYTLPRLSYRTVKQQKETELMAARYDAQIQEASQK